ncbi:plasma membrane iron permease [Rhizophagus clarus]|uniref:Plasma membrane iron permease n=1 Tax=Rhizophagus clarus TaxID=94130 RepID=A0A8H3KZU8_9GLOM|nr:plasma membrane iron permease [Rhizophagus clarus]
MAIELFNLTAFFIILRETLECTLIITILFSLIDRIIQDENQELRKELKRKIWIGIGFGVIISLIISAIFLAVNLIIEKNNWEQTNNIWETVFSFVATFLITMMAFNMIKITNWKDSIEKRLSNIMLNYLRHHRRNLLPLSLLPLTFICRESLETFILITGTGAKIYSLPIPILVGTSTGLLIGFFSSACNELEDIIGSKEIILWELNCCDPSENNGWSIAGNLFGWRNKATVASTIGYFLYWFIIIIYVLFVYNCHKNNITQQEQQHQELQSQPESNITMQETENLEISSLL